MIENKFEYINTNQLASMLGGIKPQTIHKGFCRKGMYLGLIPKKLQNGRLLWNMREINEIVFNNK